MLPRPIIALCSSLVVLCRSPVSADTDSARAYDVVVYGGTSAGVAAALQVTRMGKTVAIVEPGKVCLSASHIAYGSIRMEPVFMVLGQSAATAACQAIENDAAVQRIDVTELQTRLRADGQVLAWSAPPTQAGLDPTKLPGVVLDDSQAELTGDWATSACST